MSETSCTSTTEPTTTCASPSDHTFVFKLLAQKPPREGRSALSLLPSLSPAVFAALSYAMGQQQTTPSVMAANHDLTWSRGCQVRRTLHRRNQQERQAVRL